MPAKTINASKRKVLAPSVPPPAPPRFVGKDGKPYNAPVRFLDCHSVPIFPELRVDDHGHSEARPLHLLTRLAACRSLRINEKQLLKLALEGPPKGLPVVLVDREDFYDVVDLFNFESARLEAVSSRLIQDEFDEEEEEGDSDED